MAKRRKKNKKRVEARRIEAERAAAAGVPALASVKPRSPSGRASREVGEGYERDASVKALKARAARMGWDDADAISRARSQSLEGEAGMAIHAAASKDAERQVLWMVWAGFSAARMGYHRRILNLRSVTTSMQAMPVARGIGSASDHTPDLRSEDERDTDAIASWDRWRQKLRRISPDAANILRDAVVSTSEMVRLGVLTPRGAAFIAALRDLAQVKAD